MPNVDVFVNFDANKIDLGMWGVDHCLSLVTNIYNLLLN